MAFFLQVLILEITLKSNVNVYGRKRMSVYTHMNGTHTLNTHHTEAHRTEPTAKLLVATVQTNPIRTFQYLPEFEQIGV